MFKSIKSKALSFLMITGALVQTGTIEKFMENIPAVQGTHMMREEKKRKRPEPPFVPVTSTIGATCPMVVLQRNNQNTYAA